MRTVFGLVAGLAVIGGIVGVIELVPLIGAVVGAVVVTALMLYIGVRQ